MTKAHKLIAPVPCIKKLYLMLTADIVIING